MVKTFLRKRIYHLAGIIPVELYNQNRSENEKYRLLHPALTPITKNMTAIEHAMLSALEVGCRTLWLVMESFHIPMFRTIFGEWIYSRNIADLGTVNDCGLPLYYIPLRIADNIKISNKLNLSIIQGIRAAQKISKMITEWAEPDGYYISFPYGLFDVETVKNSRRDFQKKSRVFVSYENKTVKDNLLLPFTINGYDDCENLMNYFSMYLKRYQTEEKKMDITLSELISSYVLSKENDIMIKSDWYYSINNWESYSIFVASQKRIERPDYFKFKNLNYKVDIIGNEYSDDL